jgi:NlpC/P60 family putative phage cell wall peptidase
MSAELVVAQARKWLGTPYRHRASTLGAGCDCLGLLRGVWRGLYGAEPTSVPLYRQDARDGQAGDALEAAAQRFLIAVAGEIAAGQVALFRLSGMAHARHCGIFVSSTRFIHAQEHLGVVEANLTDAWARRLVGRFEFPH